MNVDALEAELDRPETAADPDRWALAAYRLALAKSELAASTADLQAPLDLLDRAGRILTAERAPVEHGRILTAAATCHRSAARPDRALALFEQAADLLIDRAPVAEQAAALVNVGLVNAEVGRPGPAIDALDGAVTLIGEPEDDEAGRLLGAAFVNRAQAHQAHGSDRALLAAAGDYERALATFAPATPQAAMAAHGYGTVGLELHRRGGGEVTIDQCIERFKQSLAVLLRDTFPFQHAIAQHSLAMAYERRAGDGDLTRALIHLEAAVAIFDPRLHGAQWRTAVDAIGRIEPSLAERAGRRTRVAHIVALLATTSDEERGQVLRERLVRSAGLPGVKLQTELDELATAMVGRSIDEYDRLLRTLIEVLMELPDPVLEAACGALCRANQAAADTGARDRALDTVIHDLLFGPQRVRVRDLLDAAGWVRP
ncbi:MAG: hypothetical protein ACR2QK_14025 [Acidimicrobiales bacterium]